MTTPQQDLVREALRKLVDVAWKEATESGNVPSTVWADRIIDSVTDCATLCTPARHQAGDAVAEVVWLENDTCYPPIKGHKDVDFSPVWIESVPVGTKLYTHPTEAAPAAGQVLTDEQIAQGLIDCRCGLASGELPDVAFRRGARWAERTLAASAPALQATPVVPSDAQFQEWCEKYDMQPSDRDAFNDAATLHLVAAPDAAQAAPAAGQGRALEKDPQGGQNG